MFQIEEDFLRDGKNCKISDFDKTSLPSHKNKINFLIQ